MWRSKVIQFVISIILLIYTIFRLATSSEPAEIMFQMVAGGTLITSVNILFAIGYVATTDKPVKQLNLPPNTTPDTERKIYQAQRILALFCLVISFGMAWLIALGWDFIVHQEITLPLSLFD